MIFGIIGCGAIARVHASALNEIPYAKIAGFTDMDINRAKEFATEYGGKAYSSVSEMLNDSSVDIVTICTPSGLHAQLAIEAMNAGKHVIAEKPLALTIEDCNKVIDVMEKTGKKCAVISQLRSCETVQKVKKAISDGTFGKLIECSVSMKYYRNEEYFSSSAWKGTWKGDGGGALMNQGIHGIDIMLYLMGDIKSVFGITKTMIHNIEVEDTAVAIVEFKNGAVGTIEGTTSVKPGYPRRFELSGENGTVVMTENTIDKWDLESLDDSIKSIDSISGNSYNNPLDISNTGHKMQFENVIDSILNGSEMLSDAYDGKKAVELIVSIYKSSQTGKKVFLN